MASQVLSGTGPNVSYTNNTGQNVRVVINYMGRVTGDYYITMSWGSGISLYANYVEAIGRNLAFSVGYAAGISANNAAAIQANEGTNFALPTELMLAPGQTFSAYCGAYNIVIIPENG